MHFRRRSTDRNTGAIDGGAGRGVRIGGSDPKPPAGYQSDEPAPLPAADDRSAELNRPILPFRRRRRGDK
jgi:hypothetical protein